jgi:NitT/TauT family transport system permease protein
MKITPRVRSRSIRAGIIVFSLLSFLSLWQLGSLNFTQAIPAPLKTINMANQVLIEPGPRQKTGFNHLTVSLQRVFIILSISLSLSVILGILMGLYDSVERLVSPWIPIGMTAPDVVVILITMILLGFEGTSIMIAVIFTATPFGVINMWEGMKDIDSNLVEMANSFDSSNYLVWRYIFIPHLFSYIFASSRYMLGMVWKIVLVGEAFGTDDGMGAIVRFWFNQGEILPIVAYLLLFVVTIFAIEYLVLKPLEFKLFEWRD